MTFVAAIVLLAAALTSSAATAKSKPAAKARSLEDFLPAALGGAKRQKELPPPASGAAPATGPGDAHAAYLLPDARLVNVNLTWVKDLAAERAQLKVQQAGETNEDLAAGLKHEGFDLDGVLVQRTQYLPTADGRGDDKSEARALLGDRIVVLVSVERPTGSNEPVEWMRKLDLRGLAALAAPKKSAK